MENLNNIKYDKMHIQWNRFFFFFLTKENVDTIIFCTRVITCEEFLSSLETPF